MGTNFQLGRSKSTFDPLYSVIRAGSKLPHTSLTKIKNLNVFSKKERLSV